MISFVSPTTGASLIPRDNALESSTGESFPIVNGIPRFVPPESYANAFGFQWNLHAKTQLDSKTGTTLSRTRLERCLGEPLSALRGRNVLEAGCGAGRFTELLVESGASVHSIDLSSAVEANKGNIGDRENYTVAQADIRALPFPKEGFDLVICLGVLQHTPSPEESMTSLWSAVKPGGNLVIDHYPRSEPSKKKGIQWAKWTNLSGWYLPKLRNYLKELPPEKSKRISDRWVRFFFPLHWFFRNSPMGSKIIARLSPCSFYYGLYPELSKQQQFEWSILDTYDYLADYYKHLRSPEEIHAYLTGLGADPIHVSRGGNGVEARATKPLKP